MFPSPAKRFMAACLMLAGINASAQTSTTSNPTNGRENVPYSKYGVGELSNGNNTVLKGMGDITSAYANPFQVNADNPASYASLLLTTFEVGGTASTRTIKAGDLSYTTGTASISYLNIGVPIKKFGGLAFGFRPYSHSYYSMVDTLPNSTTSSPIGRAIRSYTGEGGLNDAYLGLAGKYKGLSIGANFGYMFGTFTNTTSLIPYDTLAVNNAYIADFNNYTRVGGVYWKSGFQYLTGKDTGSHIRMRVGGTFSIRQDLKERLEAYKVAVYNFGDTIANDTISGSGKSTGRLRMPMSYSLGMMFFKPNKWSLGIDYAATHWSDFSSTPNTLMNANIASQSYRVALGGDYTPEAMNMRNYFARVTYRLGVYYGADYLEINDKSLMYAGFTAGLSLPIPRTTSRFHLSMDAGRMGSTSDGQMQTDYFRFSAGVSFNAEWFRRSGYE